jgi:predicted acetyltransferase
VTALTLPDVRLAASWAEAMTEFGDEQVHGSGNWHIPEGERRLFTEKSCALWVEELRRRGDVDVEPEPGMVHSDYYWITDGDPETVVGFLALRHSLTEWLFEQGGHIGYSVRPSRRRQGHAGRALLLALDRARELGLDRVLLTCDEDNVASRRTIEAGGGVHEDTRGGRHRLWIDLTRAADAAPVSRARGGADAAPA